MEKLSETKDYESLKETKEHSWDELLSTELKDKNDSESSEKINVEDFSQIAKKKINDLIEKNNFIKNTINESNMDSPERLLLEAKLKDIYSDLKSCNPNYEKGKEWKINCQRCVPTYEMRRRGLDVTAKPRPKIENSEDLAYHPFEVWENPNVKIAEGNGKSEIENDMKEWGDGARAQIVVVWKNTNSGHTFIAEQVNGKTLFLDPQTGKTDVSTYFDMIEPGRTKYCRIDNLETTNKINDCCKEV